MNQISIKFGTSYSAPNIGTKQFQTNFLMLIMPPPFIMGGGGGGGGAYSITLVRPYVRTYVRPVRTKNGFRAISFENLGVLDSYFIHRYIVIKYRSRSIMDKIHLLLSELWPLISK